MFDKSKENSPYLSPSDLSRLMRALPRVIENVDKKALKANTRLYENVKTIKNIYAKYFKRNETIQ